MSVIVESTVQTSIGYSMNLRTAFIQGDKLPPDDTVSHNVLIIIINIIKVFHIHFDFMSLVWNDQQYFI